MNVPKWLRRKKVFADHVSSSDQLERPVRQSSPVTLGVVDISHNEPGSDSELRESNESEDNTPLGRTPSRGSSMDQDNPLTPQSTPALITAKVVQGTLETAIVVARDSLKLLTVAGAEHKEVLSSPIWRSVFIYVCIAGCMINAYLIIHETGLVLVTEQSVPRVAIILLACFPILVLFLSKQIWTDRLGGGTFLFVFFLGLWFVCLVFNVSAIYWVYKTSYRLVTANNVQPDIAFYMKEVLPLAAAIITTIPPILLGIILFPKLGKRSDDIRSNIKIERKNSTSVTVVKTRAEGIARRYEQKFGIKWMWDDDTIYFSGLSGMAAGLGGYFQIRDDSLSLCIELPSKLEFARHVIERAASEKLANVVKVSGVSGGGNSRDENP